jgi:AAA family ATP:ADP antiporter
MGIQGGVENLPWAFTATFVAMLAAVPLYGWAVSRFPLRRLLPGVYVFFALNLAGFWALFAAGVHREAVAIAFFVWVSVFNLFVVSVFWSFMADLFDTGQAKRLFGPIAAGGSLGAVTGPAMTVAVVGSVGPERLPLVSAALLLGAVACIAALVAWGARHGSRAAAEQPAPLAGSAWAGISRTLRSPHLLAIGGYIVLFTTLSTFLYFEQAKIVRDALPDAAQRTRFFAGVDLAVNSLTLAGQLLLTGRILNRFGVGRSLASLPAITLAGFALLAVYPALWVVAGFQVLRRALNFFVARPAREVLFTAVTAEDRYKSKSFLDTVVYRGGDAVSGWLHAGLRALGLGTAGVALAALPVAALWLALAMALGRGHERLMHERRIP